jgi:hypothetical protein
MQAEEVDAETVQTVEVDAETVADTIAEELVLPPVAEVESDDGLCPDYASLEGCPKKDACELKHPTAPNGDVTMRVCTYYLSKSGCQKKARSDPPFDLDVSAMDFDVHYSALLPTGVTSCIITVQIYLPYYKKRARTSHFAGDNRRRWDERASVV